MDGKQHWTVLTGQQSYRLTRNQSDEAENRSACVVSMTIKTEVTDGPPKTHELTKMRNFVCVLVCKGKGGVLKDLHPPYLYFRGRCRFPSVARARFLSYITLKGDTRNALKSPHHAT